MITLFVLSGKYKIITKDDKTYRPHNGETKTVEIFACVGGIDIEISKYVRQQYLKNHDFRNFFGFREKQHLLQGAQDLIILILNRSAERSYIG